MCTRVRVRARMFARVYRHRPVAILREEAYFVIFRQAQRLQTAS